MVGSYVDGYTCIYFRGNEQKVFAFQNARTENFYIANEYSKDFYVETHKDKNNKITGFTVCSRHWFPGSSRKVKELNDKLTAYVRIETPENDNDPDNFVQELYAVDLGMYKVKELLEERPTELSLFEIAWMLQHCGKIC